MAKSTINKTPKYSTIVNNQGGHQVIALPRVNMSTPHTYTMAATHPTLQLQIVNIQ